MDKDIFSEELKRKIEDLTVSPSPEVWESLERRIPSRRNWKLYAAAITAAAALAGIMLSLPGSVPVPRPECDILVAVTDDIPSVQNMEISPSDIQAAQISYTPAGNHNDIPDTVYADADADREDRLKEAPRFEPAHDGTETEYTAPDRPVQMRKGKILLAAAATPGAGKSGNASGARSATFAYNNLTPELDMKHDIPVSYGIRAGYEFNERIGISTGVTYTMYRSVSSSKSLKITQKLHYISVPLDIQYSFLNGGIISVYAFAGGSADFCVSASTTERRLRTHARPEYTVHAGLGASIRISSFMSFYAEPAYTHYFNNEATAISYRTDNPDAFSLSLGLRFRL